MKTLLPLTLSACLALAAAARGQEISVTAAPTVQAPASQLLMVRVSRVKLGMTTEYEAFQRNEVVPMLKKAGVKWRDEWETAVFGENGEYTSVQPIGNLADLDGPDIVVKALGEDGARAFYARASGFLESTHVYMVRTRPDLSYRQQMNGPPKLAVVTHAIVAPGQSAEFESIIRNDWLPATARAILAKSGVTGFLMSQVGFGGNAREYTLLSLEDNFASIAKGPPATRVLGREAGAKLNQRLRAVVANIEQSVVRYMPDLSYGTGN